MTTPDNIFDHSDVVPETALILGSGLGDLADAVEDAQVVPTSEIEGFPVSSVAGHKGRVVLGRLEDSPVLVIQGRAHLYEGHDVSAVTFAVRLAHKLGARRLLVTNAAGGIHPNLSPGSLMFITDHLNFAGAAPDQRRGYGGDVITPETSAGRASAAEMIDRKARAGEAAVRTRPVASPYDAEWIDHAERCAIELGIRTRRGVYLWTRGPSYETPAEIAAFRRLGADAVGMSTVPEVLQAASLGMGVLGMSSITNRAAGLSKVTLSHEDVLRVGSRVAADVERLVRRLMRDHAPDRAVKASEGPPRR